MHTLRPTNRASKPIGKEQQELFDVIFDGNSKSFVVAPNLSKPDALRMVNYLNGGLGHKYGEPIDVQSWAMDV